VKIDGFQGEHRFLSNFWPAPVVYDGQKYPSVEFAYQAAKTLDRHERLFILACDKPGQAKKIGKSLTLRPGWDDMKLAVMEKLVRQKFTRHENLKAMLVATGDAELVETNAWGDVFWGVCDGKGENHLGKILMKVREEFRPRADLQIKNFKETP